MIKLYDKNETDFGHNGLGVLLDTLSCLVTEEDNGIFELELTCKSNHFLSEFLVNKNIIKTKANNTQDEQLFRIYRVENDINEDLKVFARHISYDLQYNFIEDIDIRDVTCKTAGEILLQNAFISHNFTFYSDIKHTSDFIMSRSNVLECILGKKGSLLDVYGNGAKLLRDNFHLSLLKDRGENNNVLISYQKNLTGYTRTIDEEDVVTAIYPYAKFVPENSEEEVVLTLPEKFIFSDEYENNKKIVAIDYSGNNITSVDTLRNISENYFINTKNHIPKVNYKVSFVELSKTLEYKDWGIDKLEKISLCDTVTIKDSRIGMHVQAKVIKTVYDSLNKEYVSIELGNFKENLWKAMNNINTNTTEKIREVNADIDVLDNKLKKYASTIENDIEEKIKDFEKKILEIKTELKKKADKTQISNVVHFSE